ncbi:hypothetical protein [Pseudomonas sp. TWR2-1-1]|uniref:hypothetical protein n=1 Tax=Pseudomonas sp. TWR2-1-1 TaxID=2804610 RepID=UPI003CF2B56A
MKKPAFDHDFLRVSREHYITGKSAINFPSMGATGGWHSLAYFDRDSGVMKLSLAGIHYPDTTVFFSGAGICDMSPELERRGWSTGGRAVFMADHYRAAADMVAKWALSNSKHCNVEIANWFPAEPDRERFLDLLATGSTRLQEIGKREKVECWLRYQ